MKRIKSKDVNPISTAGLAKLAVEKRQSLEQVITNPSLYIAHTKKKARRSSHRWSVTQFRGIVQSEAQRRLVARRVYWDGNRER